MPQAVPGEHCVVGVRTMPGAATKVFDSLVRRVVVAEYMEDALKPAIARATTKVRMARVFICVFLLGGMYV
jgi:hypothetical protein